MSNYTSNFHEEPGTSTEFKSATTSVTAKVINIKQVHTGPGNNYAYTSNI